METVALLFFLPSSCLTTRRLRRLTSAAVTSAAFSLPVAQFYFNIPSALQIPPFACLSPFVNRLVAVAIWTSQPYDHPTHPPLPICLGTVSYGLPSIPPVDGQVSFLHPLPFSPTTTVGVKSLDVCALCTLTLPFPTLSPQTRSIALMSQISPLT